MEFKLKPFKIQFSHNNKLYNAVVEQTFLSEGLEIFTVIGGKKSIKIQSNRPLIRSKGLNKRKIKMQAEHGTKIIYQSVVEVIIEAIKSYIKDLEKPYNDYKDHPKNNPY